MVIFATAERPEWGSIYDWEASTRLRSGWTEEQFVKAADRLFIRQLALNSLNARRSELICPARGGEAASNDLTSIKACQERLNELWSLRDNARGYMRTCES